MDHTDMIDEPRQIEGCDDCQSWPPVPCTLHRIVQVYSKLEIKNARDEVKSEHDIAERTAESKEAFRERARSAFPDRTVLTRHPFRGEVYGQNIGWASHQGTRTVIHTDKNCPNFPEGTLEAYPMCEVRDDRWKNHCPRCNPLANE